jgi:N-dimethylarginine dimethylaminohydrolase
MTVKSNRQPDSTAEQRQAVMKAMGITNAPPMHQRDEHSTLREVAIGHTVAAAYPPKGKSTEKFANHIPYLAGDFYDQFEVGEYISIEKHAPEITEAYNNLHRDLKNAYEAEGVIVNVIAEPKERELNYFGWAEGTGYWPLTLASVYQVFGDVCLEMITSDNILESGLAGFSAREIYRKKFNEDKNAIWCAMSASKPYNQAADDSDTLFIQGGDIRMLDDKNILIGVGHATGQEKPTSTNYEGADHFKRLMEKFGFNVHIVDFNGNLSFHMDYLVGSVAPNTYAVIEGTFINGVPEVMKDADIIWLPAKDSEKAGANIVSLGPDASGQYRVMVPTRKACPTLVEGLEARGIRPVEIECELVANTGGSIRCATLTLSREDNEIPEAFRK